jgi:hypothetical protein
MMPIMVPDIVPPTDEVRGKCVAVANDLHEVQWLLETGWGAQVHGAE